MNKQPQLPLSPSVANQKPYPFAALEARRKAMQERGVDMIDLSIGDPKEITPDPMKRALIEALDAPSSYPRVLGTDELRGAITDWIHRRFGVELDPDRHVLPTNGSKEAVFTLPLAVVDRDRRPVVLAPDPAYPVYELGVEAAGGEFVRTPLLAGNNFLPDLDAIPESTWKRTSLLWINYPNNPTGAVAPPDFLEAAVRKCREHGVLLASDEAYTEIWFEEPPHTALEWGTENVVILHTLSKRSAMPGYRSGFMAGDERLMDALKRFRPGVGVATPGFVQAAAKVAWDDQTHVDVIRERFKSRRNVVVEGLRELGFTVSAAPATIYVWAALPGGESSEEFVSRCIEAGVVLLPGVAMGPSGEGYVRVSLTVNEDQLAEAVRRMGGALQRGQA